MRFLRRLIVLWALGSSAAAGAAEAFLPRTPALSPDGGTVVFSFQGDLWSVPAEGGSARRLTAHAAYDHHPVFSPDGTRLAFSSNRYGDDDVFVMPAQGGTPLRLTHASTPDVPQCFAPDGGTVFFAARRPFDFPGTPQIQLVPATGGTPFRLAEFCGDEAATYDGETFVIAEGRVKPARLRYRGSFQRELYAWRRGGDPVRLTANRGYDQCPMVGPDGRIWWLGDQDPSKTANVFVMDADGANQRQVTDWTEDGVRSAALSRDGSRLVLERETGLWLAETAGGAPRRLRIEVADDQLDNPVVIGNRSDGAEGLAVSVDGQEIALALAGEIVLVSKELGGRGALPAPGPHLEKDLSFRPGGSDTLLLVSDRFGEDEICLLVSDDADQSLPRLARRSRLVRLTPDRGPAGDPLWSPDGSRILYTSGNGTLRVMAHDGSDDRELFRHWSLAGACWSPDGRWIAFSRYDGDFNSDVMIIPADGGEAVNVTLHPDYDEQPVWSADGSVLAWTTSRHAASPNGEEVDVYALYLTREDHERTREEWKIIEKMRDKEKEKAKEKGKQKGQGEPGPAAADVEDDLAPTPARKPADEPAAPAVTVKIDFADIHLRARRLTRLPGAERVVALAEHGDRVIFTAQIDGKTDLYSVDRFGEDRKALTSGGVAPTAVRLLPDGQNLVFLKGGKPARVGSDGGEVETTDFSARLTIDRPAVRLQVLDEGWRMLRDHFYDPAMHGVDWPALRAKYGAWVQRVSHDVDFGDVVNFMLGELNASHMGYYPDWESPGDYGTDGYLGLEFADKDPGPGLRVVDVLPYGPCDKERARLQPGDRLLRVEGQEVGPDRNLYAALETRADLPTWLTFERDGKELEVSVTPAAWRPVWELEYQRMERGNRSRVESASAGRVGYVHIQGMGYTEVERFEQNLFAAADGKEALVIDVRNNGGGWTTDLLLTILTQPVHAYTVARGGPAGYPQSERQPFYRWAKPIAVICNEGSYSNAEIFSHAVKTIGRGPVVGTETGGNVISTGAFGNRYRGTIRLPSRGWYVWGDERHPERNGKNEEGVHDLTGCLPDFPVDRTLADRLHGRDPQLDKAVELMLQAADAERAKPQPEAGGR